ncbi:MAG: hypothetical protein ABR594_11940 [Pyrinomonadaceae bacterium]
MSLSQVLEALPEFTVEERQLLIRRAMELDEPPLSEADEKRSTIASGSAECDYAPPK